MEESNLPPWGSPEYVAMFGNDEYQKRLHEQVEAERRAEARAAQERQRAKEQKEQEEQAAREQKQVRAERQAKAEARDREAIKQYKAVCKEYQTATKKVQGVSAKILKGLASGEELAILFLQAAEAYTLCTGNRAEFDAIKDMVQTTYGVGLHDAGAVAYTRQQLQGRLQRLQAAFTAADSDEKQTLKKAITAHEAKLKKLEGLH